MFNYIDKLRNIPSRSRVDRGRGTRRTQDRPLDQKLSFKPFPDERWTFEEGRKVRLNDVDVDELVREGKQDVRVLSGLTQGLHDYQQYVWAKGGKGCAQFNAAVTSLQDRILGRLGGMYDSLSDGITVEFAGEDFWLNNVNVRSVLKLYWLRPTEKARRYLMGLREKLVLILERRRTTSRHDGVRLSAERMLDELTLAVEHLPADAPLLLGDGRGSARGSAAPS